MSVFGACQVSILALLGGAGRVAGSPEAQGRENRTFAFARTDGGIILSGPKDCRGSTKDARILPVFLHSPAEQIDCQRRHRAASLTTFEARQSAIKERNSLLMDEGSGLLSEKPIVKL